MERQGLLTHLDEAGNSPGDEKEGVGRRGATDCGKRGNRPDVLHGLHASLHLPLHILEKQHKRRNSISE